MLVCNAVSDADDLGPVRVTVLWLGTVLALAGGHAIARSEAIAAIVPSLVPILVVLAWTAGALAAVATIRRVPPALHGGPRPATVLALVALAFARGLGAGPVAGVPVGSGAVDWPARAGDHGRVLHFEVRDASWSGARCSVLASPQGSDRTAWLELPSDRCPLSRGDGIVVPARSLRPSAGPTWPGAADPRQQASSRGASWVLTAERAWPSARGDGSWRASWSRHVAAARARWWLDSRGDDGRALVVSSLFGVRAALSPPRRRALAIAGLGHLVAVSGMQVTLVAWVAFRMALRASAVFVPAPGLAAALALVPVAAYVALVGAEAPAVRSALLVVALSLSSATLRPSHGVTVLAWSAAAMLAWRPAWAFDVGFQLSFVAMAALLRAPAGLAMQSWRVAWAIAPVVALHFGETGAWAVVTNLAAVPVFTLALTPAGLFAVLTEPWLGDLAWVPAGWAAALVLDIAAIGAALPRVSLAALAWVAAASLSLRAWPRLAASPRWQRWAPTPIVATAVLTAWCWSLWRPRPPLPEAPYFAFGPRRNPAVLARAGEGAACLREPTGDPTTWPSLLDALAIDRIVALGPSAEPLPPHVVALRDELAATSPPRWTGSDAAAQCDWPSRARAEAAIAACRRRHAGPSFAAFDHHAVHCWDGERWLAPLRLQ
ncbi:MAG: ComEC/Rec2 family competence protein [Nannocystaceae bacterium]|nr:ComEC/Rec2 family competence protein [Nannocystaceae bacterium]